MQTLFLLLSHQKTPMIRSIGPNGKRIFNLLSSVLVLLFSRPVLYVLIVEWSNYRVLFSRQEQSSFPSNWVYQFRPSLSSEAINFSLSEPLVPSSVLFPVNTANDLYSSFPE